MGYRVPKEWGSLTETQRGLGSLGAFKRQSKAGFLAAYGAFRCSVRACFVCGERRGGVGLGGNEVATWGKVREWWGAVMVGALELSGTVAVNGGLGFRFLWLACLPICDFYLLTTGPLQFLY